MHIQSTNLAKPKTIEWQNKKITTGIFKTPTPKPIYLNKNGVKDDFVADTKVHGGFYKACYFFSSDHYPYWKKLYPQLKWSWGMFGENITVNGMNEKHIMVGDIYKLGEAIVQVTQPREPCFKFGVKFGSQSILNEFINHGFPGTYASIIQEGFVEKGDEFSLIERPKTSISVTQLNSLFFSKNKNQEHLKIITSLNILPERKINTLKSFIK